MLDDIRIAVDVDHISFNRQTLRADGSQSRYQRLRLNGPFGADYGIRALSVRDCSRIVLEGSFAGFLQGHNVVGPMDLQFLVAEVIRRVLPRLGAVADRREQRRIDTGRIKLERLDVVGFIDAEPFGGPRKLVRHLDIGLAGSRVHRSQFGSDSLIWHTQSSSWSLSAYNKIAELLARHQEVHARLDPLLKEIATNLLRVELRLLRPELERLGWTEVRNVRRADVERVFGQRLDEFLQDLRQPYPPIGQLPSRPSRSLLMGLLFAQGIDFISSLGERRQREVRRELLDEHGIDLRASVELPARYATAAQRLRQADLRVRHGFPRAARDSGLVFTGD